MSSAWHVVSGTDGCEGPYGVESVSKRSTGIVWLHERVCVCVCLPDLVCHMCTYGLCILCSTYRLKLPFLRVCMPVCEENKPLIFFFFLDNSPGAPLTSPPPPRVKLTHSMSGSVCRRRAKYTTLLTSVCQRQHTSTHGPPTRHSGGRRHMSTKRQIERDPVGPANAAIYKRRNRRREERYWVNLTEHDWR